MGKHFFDFDDDDFVHPISDNMAIDDEGNLHVIGVLQSIYEIHRTWN